MLNTAPEDLITYLVQLATVELILRERYHVGELATSRLSESSWSIRSGHKGTRPSARCQKVGLFLTDLPDDHFLTDPLG